MTHLIQIISTYVSVHHDGLLALVGGAAGLSAAIQWFLHKFKISGPVVSFVVSHLFAMATAAAAYVLDSVHPNAGVTWGWIWVAAQVWHRFVINPAYNVYVLPFLSWLSNQKTTVAEPIPTSTLVTDSLE